MINTISIVLVYALPNGLGSWPMVCTRLIAVTEIASNTVITARTTSSSS